MSRNRRMIAAMLVAKFGIGIASAASAEDCLVADPTGTPLNLRLEPNGQILSRLDNGLTVQVVDERIFGDKRWAQVATDGKMLGWVFAAYLRCKAEDDTLKSAPMRPRTAPQ